MSASVQKFFPTEKLWVTICGTSGDEEYAITTPSEYDRRTYSIYKICPNKPPKLLGQGADPAGLEHKYIKT